MRDEIKVLIAEHKMAMMEVRSLLEELSQIDEVKLSYQEYEALKELKSNYLMEVSMRELFIGQLEGLL